MCTAGTALRSAAFLRADQPTTAATSLGKSLATLTAQTYTQDPSTFHPVYLVLAAC